MAASDYTWVSTPHTPYTISGSDPHIPSTDYWQTTSHRSQARLVAWYNWDEGNYISGSAKAGETGRKCVSVRDLSQNSRRQPYSPVNIGATSRHLQPDNYYPGVVSGNVGPSTDPNLWIKGDRHQFLMGSYAWTTSNHRSLHMGLANPGTSVTSGDVEHEWISSSSDASHEQGTMCGGYSIHAALRHHTDTNDRQYAFGVSYPTSEEDGYYYNGFDSNFSLALTNDNSNRNAIMGWNENRYRIMTTNQPSNDWHILNGVYDRQTSRTQWACRLYMNNKLEGEQKNSPGSGDYPRQQFWHKRIAIGGRYDYGGGHMNQAASKKDMTVTGTGSYINGISEFFIFDDKLSDIRRTQMDAYLCDRHEVAMSSSFYLSQFSGEYRGSKGEPKAHDQLSNALSGKGTYCRRYQQWNTGSGQAINNLQHETVAGAFAKSTLDSGAYYNTPSTQALSLRMWVRAERLNDVNHSGSHVALVAKASSPWGNKLDHIKGYSLKFGTFLNGLDTGDNAPKFILSLRNSDRWDDGVIDDGCTDITVTNNGGGTPASITTPAIDTWYNIRLDVIPFGLVYDQIKAYASLDGSTWYQLGSTLTIERTDLRYRNWSNDPTPRAGWNKTNGTHNGYYVAMSSSNGKTLYTTYYVDDFQIMTDAVQ